MISLRMIPFGMLLAIPIILTLSKPSSASSVTQCKYPEEQIYSAKAGRCLSLVGGPCDPVEKLEDTPNATANSAGENSTLVEFDPAPLSSGCIPGAECFKDTLFGYCFCANGLMPTEDRKCVLNYGSTCNRSDSDGLVCDERQLLGCIDGQCRCKNILHVYDPVLDECVGKVGAFCKPNVYRGIFGVKSVGFGYQLNPNPEDNIVCVPGASCYVVFGDPTGNGVCRCTGLNSRENANRTCDDLSAVVELSRCPCSSEEGGYPLFIIFSIVIVFPVLVFCVLKCCCGNLD